MSQASDFAKHFLASLEPALLKAFDAVASVNPVAAAIDTAIIHPVADAVEAHNPQYFTQPTHVVNSQGSPVAPVTDAPVAAPAPAATPAPDALAAITARLDAIEARVAALEPKDAAPSA